VVNSAAQPAGKALTTATAEVKWLNGFSLAASFEGEFLQHDPVLRGQGSGALGVVKPRAN
jgi:hypothetical protein